MNKYDKAKLKVLIKMILIERSPKSLSASQLCDIINGYDWGFKTNISSAKIGKLISSELRKYDKNFLSNIEYYKKKNVLYYSIPKNVR